MKSVSAPFSLWKNVENFLFLATFSSWYVTLFVGIMYYS